MLPASYMKAEQIINVISLLLVWNYPICGAILPNYIPSSSVPPKECLLSPDEQNNLYRRFPLSDGQSAQIYNVVDGHTFFSTARCFHFTLPDGAIVYKPCIPVCNDYKQVSRKKCHDECRIMSECAFGPLRQEETTFICRLTLSSLPYLASRMKPLTEEELQPKCLTDISSDVRKYDLKPKIQSTQSPDIDEYQKPVNEPVNDTQQYSYDYQVAFYVCFFSILFVSIVVIIILVVIKKLCTKRMNNDSNTELTEVVESGAVDSSPANHPVNRLRPGDGDNEPGVEGNEPRNKGNKRRNEGHKPRNEGHKPRNDSNKPRNDGYKPSNDDDTSEGVIPRKMGSNLHLYGTSTVDIVPSNDGQRAISMNNLESPSTSTATQVHNANTKLEQDDDEDSVEMSPLLKPNMYTMPPPINNTASFNAQARAHAQVGACTECDTSDSCEEFDNEEQ